MILSELDDIGLPKTIGGETTSTVWYLTKRMGGQRASIDTLAAVMAVVVVGVVVTSVHVPHKIVIDQVTITENLEGQEITDGAVGASITSIVTKTRILRAVADILSMANPSPCITRLYRLLKTGHGFSSTFASSGLCAIRRILLDYPFMLLC
jgi:hypothetical protein